MDAIDHVVLASIRKAWNATTLPALLDRLPGAGRVHSPQEQPLPDVYGQLTCEAFKLERYNKPVRKDRRKVVLRVYGAKDKAQAAQTLMQAAFSEQMGDLTHKAITLPDGWNFISLLHEKAPTLKQDERVKSGQDIWISELTCIISFSSPEGA